LREIPGKIAPFEKFWHISKEEARPGGLNLLTMVKKNLLHIM
jgi:hypothetical protein